MTTLTRRFVFLFFFQAEDGIRFLPVTGVQTCALPISCGSPCPRWVAVIGRSVGGRTRVPPRGSAGRGAGGRGGPRAHAGTACDTLHCSQIGRAAWRGRGEISVGAVSLKKKKKKR